MEGTNYMNIFTKVVVSHSGMINNYKFRRKRTEVFGRIFVLKNKRPDVVLFSIEEDIVNFFDALPKLEMKKAHSFDFLRQDITY